MLAERLAQGSGKQVLLVDRRPHIGGNAYDRFDDAGILIHKYGPHIFHTNSREVFDYLSRFTEWRQYQHRVLAHVDGQLVPIPINLDTINRLYGLSLNSFQMEDFLASRAEKIEQVRTSEDVVVSKVGRELYEKFFRGYTRKQWGLDPSELDAQVTARVPTRTNRDDRYFTDTYQAMPKRGYTRMFENMLDHPNIHILLNTDYRAVRQIIPHREVIYCGPVDEFFDFRFGKLPYRCLEFKHETLNCAQYQPAAVVNYPNDYPYTRVTEFKHLTGQEHPKTSIVTNSRKPTVTSGRVVEVERRFHTADERVVQLGPFRLVEIAGAKTSGCPPAPAAQQHLRASSDSLDISSEKTATVCFSLSATCWAMLSARAVLPIDGARPG